MKQLNLNSRRLRGLSARQKKGFLKYRKSIYNFPPFDDDRYKKIIEEVFENSDFIRQLSEVKVKLEEKYDPELIEDVIKFHIRKSAEELTKVRPWKRRLYIFKWSYIEIFPLCFNAYSLYYDHSKTMKFLKKYKKEVEQIKNQTK